MDKIEYQELRVKLDKYVNDYFVEYPTRKHRTAINKLLRAMDDSNLWPIHNKFNATNRAINRYNRLCVQYGCEIADSVYSYSETVQSIISEIVNNEG